MGARRRFSRGGGNSDIAYLFQNADDTMKMDVNKRFTLSAPQR